MNSSSGLVDQATNTLATAVAVFDSGAADPGPLAGPHAALAIPLLNAASGQFEAALSSLPPDTLAMIPLQLALLRDGCKQQAQNLVGAALVPWPFVYAALGPIGSNLNGLLGLAHLLQNELRVLPAATTQAMANPVKPAAKAPVMRVGDIHTQFSPVVASNGTS